MFDNNNYLPCKCGAPQKRHKDGTMYCVDCRSEYRRSISARVIIDALNKLLTNREVIFYGKEYR